MNIKKLKDDKLDHEATIDLVHCDWPIHKCVELRWGGKKIHREISNQINVIIVLLFSSTFIFLDQSQHVGFSRMKGLLTFFCHGKQADRIAKDIC